MNLKEAFSYQNDLTQWIYDAEGYLRDTGFILKKTEEHHLHKTNPDATDEKIVVAKSRDIGCTPNDIVDFVVDAIKEKDKLTFAISEAKKSMDIDIDASIAMNKMKQQFVSIMRNMCANKDTSVTTPTGIGYLFDINHEQKTYCYDVTTTKQIDFNRNHVRHLIQMYQKDTDKVSSDLDLALLTTEVDYEPKWNAGDGIFDLLENQ